MSETNEPQLMFAEHPLRAEIQQRWDKGESSTAINEWLKAEHPDVVISVPTLCKHYKRYNFNKEQRASLDSDKQTARKKKKKLPVEDILWETIMQCRKMKKSAHISVKEWQYLDQQMQCAIEKLIRISDTGNTQDMSKVLSDIFSKIESEGDVDIDSAVRKEMSDKEKLQVIKEADDESKIQQEQDTEIP